MKPKTSDFGIYRRQFPPIPIFLSDLEQLIDAARARDLSPKISDETHEYDNLDDLTSHQKSRISRLTIELELKNLSSRDLEVKFDSDGVELSVDRDDALLALWHDVVPIFERRTAWYARFLGPVPRVIAALISIALALTLSLDLLPVTAVASLLTFLIAILLISLYYSNFVAGVHLRKPHEVRGILEEYGGKIFLLVVGAAIGVIAQWLASSLLGK